MSSIEHINKLINEVILDIDNLIVEQSSVITGYSALLKDPNVTDEEKIQKL